ncbi:ScbA/BarX family gamma-butyrolactone biosynthesis protein [Streptomyces sp.]|uniref:ScbA/BarX family gamma-butyrolactone biosynthesis protein n=1 Tax=Streptomyces sp. TaxID=1931 RepID=UPI002F416E6F
MTTTAVSPDGLRPEDTELTYSRTVDRDLVHRDSLGEVFLTDLRVTGETGESGYHAAYTAAAQLPRSHAYYGDHLLRPSAYDPVLLLEACRQAALAGAHEFYGVPGSHKFILTHLRIGLTRPENTVVGSAPCRLTLRVVVGAHRRKEGRTTGLDYEIGLYAQDLEIGTASVGLRFKSPEGYLQLRLANRDGKPLPSSATLMDRVPSAGVAPYQVGRNDPGNVVLADTRVTGGVGGATLRIPASHPSMFDHPQDHLPGMVIAEAARQLALLTALETRAMSPSRTPLSELSLVFTRFGELEKLTELTCEPVPDSQDGVAWTQGGPLDPDDDSGGLRVRGTCLQEGETLCMYSLTLGPAEGRS